MLTNRRSEREDLCLSSDCRGHRPNWGITLQPARASLTMSASTPSSSADSPPAATASPGATDQRPTPSVKSTQGTAAEPQDGQVYAIVEAAGQQFWLQPNRYLDLDRLDAEVESTLTLETVLLLKGAQGTTLGQPYVKGASVVLKVLAHRRGPKILVYKMRRKKKTRRKTGHRQELTRVIVQSIQVGGKSFS
ncbi:MAG: ribosomal protein [Cyanobacteriota bacterium]